MPTTRSRRVPALLIESALIVLSVLLGFVATAWQQRRGERALAAEAEQNFRREIAENLQALEAVQPKHAAVVARLGELAATPRAGETAFLALRDAMPAGGMAVPPLADAAWETATSTGALRFLGYERAAHISVPYQIQRTTLFQTIMRLEVRLSDPDTFDPARREPTLRALALLLDELNGQESHLIEVYRATLRQLGPGTR